MKRHRARVNPALRLCLRAFLLGAALLPLALSGCGKKKTGERESLIRFSAAGNLMLDRGVRVWVEKNGPAYPFQPVSSFLQSRDLVAANFEMALDHGCQALQKPEVFRLPEAELPELERSGINALNLANDHSLDCGREALGQAFRWMLATGIQPLGAGDNSTQAQQPVYLTVNGITLGLLAFTTAAVPGAPFCRECTGPAFYEPNLVSRLLAEMERRADFRIVFFHWEEAARAGPHPDPKTVAHEAINSGADLVIGFGPEAVAGLERIQGKWVIYSLGNLVSDPATPQGQEGLIFSAEFAPRRMLNPRLLPIRIEKGQASFARGDEARAILEHVMALSGPGSRSEMKLVEDILYLQ
jgi:poly-gamma-glutamate synthesis protein (capsule biosynthesis protein)